MQQVMTHSGPLLWAGAVWGFWCRLVSVCFGWSPAVWGWEGCYVAG